MSAPWQGIWATPLDPEFAQVPYHLPLESKVFNFREEQWRLKISVVLPASRSAETGGTRLDSKSAPGSTARCLLCHGLEIPYEELHVGTFCNGPGMSWRSEHSLLGVADNKSGTQLPRSHVNLALAWSKGRIPWRSPESSGARYGALGGIKACSPFVLFFSWQRWGLWEGPSSWPFWLCRVWQNWIRPSPKVRKLNPWFPVKIGRPPFKRPLPKVFEVLISANGLKYRERSFVCCWCDFELALRFFQAYMTIYIKM